MSSDNPTELGWHLMKLMARAELSQSALAREIGIAQGTISRWIYSKSRPRYDPLERAAQVFERRGVLDKDGRATFMALAGYGDVSAAINDVAQPVRLLPLAAELNAQLDENSPLDERERGFLREAVDRLLDRNRRVMRRGRTS